MIVNIKLYSPNNTEIDYFLSTTLTLFLYLVPIFISLSLSLFPPKSLYRADILGGS